MKIFFRGVINFFNKARDLLFPPLCYHCHIPLNGFLGLCESCCEKLSFTDVNQVCSRCADGLMDQQGHVCGACLTSPPYYDAACSIWEYDGWIKRLILSFKYSDQQDLARFYSPLLVIRGWELLDAAHVIMPVPLHNQRLKQRKYNQAGILAQRVGKLWNRPVDLTWLQRHEPTPILKGLTLQQRYQSVRGAFSISLKSKDRYQGKNVVLIDDVMTTGATVNECARILKKNGVKNVSILVIARVMKK